MVVVIFSLALLELMGVKIPQKHSQVITDASHPCTHTGSWITIFFLRVIALWWLLFFKSSRGHLGLWMNVQPLMDKIQMEMLVLLWTVKLSCDLLEQF